MRRPLHQGVPLQRDADAAPNLTAAWSIGSSAGIESARPTRDVPRPRVQRCRPPRRLPDALGARRRASAPRGLSPAQPHLRAALHRSAFRFGACTLPLPGSEAL